MDGLKIQLLDCFYRNKPHCWAMNSLRDRLSVEIVVLVALQIRPHELRGHETCVVAHHY